MEAPLARKRGSRRRWVQHLGLAFMLLGVFLERPDMFATSILLLLVSTPLRELGRRITTFKVELLVLMGLIAVQWAAHSPTNALVLTLYLMGLLNGMLLPHPRVIGPRSWASLAIACLLLALLFTSSLAPHLGLSSEGSAFGTNPDDYRIDPRSLTYAVFIFLLYQGPYFRGRTRFKLHISLMLAVAALGTNKFGMLYAALFRVAPRLVIPVLLLLATALTAAGIASVGFTADRAALWSNFFSNFPICDSAYGVCTGLISASNEEGVRSFHSIALDFLWYGGIAGLAGALYFLLRVAMVPSNFGRSAAVLFAMALLFGFPPFFNERHVLIVYAVLILFSARHRGLSHRTLRANRSVPFSGGRAATVPRRHINGLAPGQGPEPMVSDERVLGDS
ncbi:hypothetical protein [Hydrogenophaga laconesensis]|uniref:O-antigen ligase like membrane protein n=1 Tax=Hydrogenophaga laconesensis TaxID=1805971 RepID=A0ABU1VGY7_9BURK|nr:hypothetical protein [Hydrogenophaga laconesensis]MDR7096752.1 hypothetical protein [Hydrogenophaga laconesensis]